MVQLQIKKGLKRRGVELCVTKPEHLAAARLRIKAARSSYVESNLDWLDAKKTRQQLKPARLLTEVQNCYSKILVWSQKTSLASISSHYEVSLLDRRDLALV